MLTVPFTFGGIVKSCYPASERQSSVRTPYKWKVAELLEQPSCCPPPPPAGSVCAKASCALCHVIILINKLTWYKKNRSWKPIKEKDRLGQLMTGLQCVALSNYHLPQQEMDF